MEEEESLILQELHRNTVQFMQALEAVAVPSLQQHGLRRPLRNLDRSLERLQNLWHARQENLQRQQRQQQQQQQQQGSLNSLPEEGDGDDDPTIVLLGTHHTHHDSQIAASQHSKQQKQDEASIIMAQQYEHATQDLWTILIRLPVCPTEESLTNSILRRTVQLLEHLLPPPSATQPAAAAVQTLYQLIAQTPDCLFTVHGMAWVRVVNQWRPRMADPVAPQLAWPTLGTVLPIVLVELRNRMSTITTSSPHEKTTRFLFDLMELLANVLMDLVATYSPPPNDDSFSYWEQWWTHVTGVSQPQQQQVITYWMDQLQKYTMLLLEFTQDELDQACSQVALHRQQQQPPWVPSLSPSASLDLVWLTFVSLQHLQTWEAQCPALDCTRRLYTLWESLAQVNVSLTFLPEYETCYLPTLVILTQHVLKLSSLEVDLPTFIAVWLRLVPFAHMWVHVNEIWSYMKHCQQQQAQQDDDVCTKSPWQSLRRLIQLVLLTMSPTKEAEAHVCLGLQALLNDGCPRDESMADLYFAHNYHPMDSTPK